MEQYVYAVGGYDGTDQLHSVERYDVETNQWEMLANMNIPRSALSVAVIFSSLYALGRSWSTALLCINVEANPTPC